MPTRLRPLTHPVEILHDGDAISAESEESLAHALLGADRLVLTRSPKLHRPRGPYCLRGACEGCLVRLNGIPNVMACRHRVMGGERVETQNVLGTRKLDLLAATDFFFPHGLDHHRIFAGVRGVSGIVTSLARRIAGLGKLPTETTAIRPADVLDVAVLIVGGGGAGLTAAAELGSLATLVDDGLELGGALALLAPPSAADLVGRARSAGATLRPRTTAVGIYPDPEANGRLTVLLAGEGSASLVFARAVLLATGEHDATPDFPGNDLPGVLSVRAGLDLLRAGILPDDRVALIGSSAFSSAAAERLGTRVAARAAPPEVVRAEGRLRVEKIVLRTAEGERSVRVGALLYDAPGSPVFELAVQAGAQVTFQPGRGYVPLTDADGRAAANTWCTGRLRDPSQSTTQASVLVAQAIRRALA